MLDSSDNPSEKFRQLLSDITPRQAQFLRFYLDPQGPAFANATKAAELAGYAGEPGGNQLAVQGSRVLRNPQVQQCLQDVFAAAGCTLELDAQVIREALGATRTKFVVGDNNQILATPPQPDHAVRLRAVELKHRLVRASRPANTPGSIAPLDSAGTTQLVRADALSPECAEAIQKVAELTATDRVLLREVVASDDRLGNSEVSEEDPCVQHEQQQARGDNPGKA